MLDALSDIGLGYLRLGQPSPTLSGGEAQRVKLAKFLGRGRLAGRLMVLDEPSTGLHPADISGLLAVFDRLVRSGATLIVIEHNPDIIRAADWIVDLGPGAGPEGGRLLYAGPFRGLLNARGSLTAQALRKENELTPAPARDRTGRAARSSEILIQGARANNLRNLNARFPKGKLTVVTGVSGSGKSSLVSEVLEAEAKKRFLETLSLYERQAVKEGPETQADAVKGLRVSLSIEPYVSRMYNPRSDVGLITDASHHLAVLLAGTGERACPSCGKPLRRGGPRWECGRCGTQGLLPEPRHFSPRTYAAACPACHGVGSFQGPKPEKLIIHPDKPLCGGAMYSPGFFPHGYLCKPFNGGYDIVQALAERHGFDTHSTPWNRMGKAARKAFLFGEEEPLDVTFRNRAGMSRRREVHFKGFYGWVRDWDVTGTYTERRPCGECGGSRLRPEYSSVTLAGRPVMELNGMSLSELGRTLARLSLDADTLSSRSLHTITERLSFLSRVGLGYLHLGRLTASLSAGEAQRVRLAGLLGSGLTALTVILDEPTRGMHPSEVEALARALGELRDAGNTVIVVEHDLTLIRRADRIIEMGPGAGVNGGRIVARGAPEKVAAGKSLTGRWLRDPSLRGRPIGKTPSRRTPRGWLTIEDPSENNLKGGEARIPLGVLCGVCGVSGSGKSTLLIDTLGRALAPRKHTTSIAREPVEPGAHRAIIGAPRRTLIIDQARAGLGSPLAFLGLEPVFKRLYAKSGAARELGLDAAAFGRKCTACRGSGSQWIDMGFLPDVSVPCEPCRGTGYPREAREILLRGASLPQLVSRTIDEVYALWHDNEAVTRPLGLCRDAGIGYLTLNQKSLSGGEAQRLKMAGELMRKSGQDTLLLLDEPTVGLHAEDVLRLAAHLSRIVDGGWSVVVIEHNPILLSCCDWLIEMGPGGGPDGGRIIAEGAPREISGARTPTAPYIAEILG
jgi:excinuclease ABC subunit A